MMCFTVSFASCGRPNKPSPIVYTTHEQLISLGDTVTKLGNDIGCIFQDGQGNHWFASNGGGAYRYNGKVLIRYTQKDGLASNYVWNIQQDVNGVLWFSTRDGVSSFDGKRIANRSYAIESAINGSINPDTLGLFFPNKKGLCYYNGRSFINLKIEPESYLPNPTSAASPYAVYSTLVDQSGTAWFGTQSEGVCRYDRNTLSYLTDKDLAGPAVRTIYQDRKGVLWFGNNGGGLFRFDGKRLSNITEEKKLGNDAFLKNKLPISKTGSLARVWAIQEDTSGNLLIGTIDSGLWIYDGQTLVNVTSKDGLPGNSIWVIYKDRDGTLWMVSNGDTVFRYEEGKCIKAPF